MWDRIWTRITTPLTLYSDSTVLFSQLEEWMLCMCMCRLHVPHVTGEERSIQLLKISPNSGLFVISSIFLNPLFLLIEALLFSSLLFSCLVCVSTVRDGLLSDAFRSSSYSTLLYWSISSKNGFWRYTCMHVCMYVCIHASLIHTVMGVRGLFPCGETQLTIHRSDLIFEKFFTP